MKKLLFALMLFVLVAGPVVYLMSRRADTAFVDTAVANGVGGLVSSVIAIVAGVPIALWLSSRQQNQQLRQAQEDERRRQAKEAAEREAEQRRLLELSLDRIRRELEQNQALLGSLEEILGASDCARTDLWAWAGSEAIRFEFDAYRDLRSSALFATLAPTVRHFVDSDLDLAYSDLRRFRARIEGGEKAHAFYLGHAADERKANWRWQEAAAAIKIVGSEVKRATEVIVSRRWCS